VAPSLVRCKVPLRPLSHSSMKAGSLNSSVASPARLLVSKRPPSSKTGCSSFDEDVAVAVRILLESVMRVLSLRRAPDGLRMAGRVVQSASGALWGPKTWAELSLLTSPLTLALQVNKFHEGYQAVESLCLW